MEMLEQEVPQEQAARNAIRRAEDSRRGLQQAGFSTCTKNGMLCRHAQGVEVVKGETKVKCGYYTAAPVSLDEAKKCMRTRLMPVSPT